MCMFVERINTKNNSLKTNEEQLLTSKLAVFDLQNYNPCLMELPSVTYSHCQLDSLFVVTTVHITLPSCFYISQVNTPNNSYHISKCTVFAVKHFDTTHQNNLILILLQSEVKVIT